MSHPEVRAAALMRRLHMQLRCSSRSSLRLHHANDRFIYTTARLLSTAASWACGSAALTRHAPSDPSRTAALMRR